MYLVLFLSYIIKLKSTTRISSCLQTDVDLSEVLVDDLKIEYLKTSARLSTHLRVRVGCLYTCADGTQSSACSLLILPLCARAGLGRTVQSSKYAIFKVDDQRSKTIEVTPIEQWWHFKKARKGEGKAMTVKEAEELMKKQENFMGPLSLANRVLGKKSLVSWQHRPQDRHTSPSYLRSRRLESRNPILPLLLLLLLLFSHIN